jgi:hypothetical protein
MEETTIQKVKNLVESLSFDYDKFENGNKTAGTRVRKTAQELKDLMQTLRKEILESRKN